MSERIEDIIGDIRAQNQGLPEDSYALSPYVSDLLRLADRIEAAAKALEADRDNWRRQALDEDARANAINSAANTNVDAKVYSKSEMIESVVKAATQAVQLTNEKFARSVGNVAKMREALEDSNGLLEELALIGEWSESARGQIAENNAAIFAPPRNCDMYKTPEEALKSYGVPVYGESASKFLDWLFTEAKGAAK